MADRTLGELAGMACQGDLDQDSQSPRSGALAGSPVGDVDSRRSGHGPNFKLPWNLKVGLENTS